MMITVEDIMQTDVVAVAPDATVGALIHLLAENDISGVPVVDDAGLVVGVVSTTDVVHLAADADEDPALGSPASDPDPTGAWGVPGEDPDDDTANDLYNYFLTIRGPLVPVDSSPVWTTANELSQHLVRDIMTPAAFHIGPSATVPELATFLLRGRIHRALVMDRDCLVGIVTTIDVLKAVAEMN